MRSCRMIVGFCLGALAVLSVIQTTGYLRLAQDRIPAIAMQMTPEYMHFAKGLPLLLRLYAFPGGAAIAAVAGACMVCRPWAKRLLLALAVVLIVPVPVESRPPPAVIVPLGLFLMLATAFPKMVCLVVFHTTCLAAILWLVGVAGGALKRWIQRESRRVSLFVGFGLMLAVAAVATTAVAVATYHTAFDTAFREMK